MEIIFIIIALATLGVLGLLIFLIFKLNKKIETGENQNSSMFNQKIDLMQVSLSQALRDTVKLVGEQLKESRESVERSSLAIHTQVQGFTSGLTSLSEGMKQISESMKEVSSFQQIFKAPKLRGRWGEVSLESALSQGFSKSNFQLQYPFKSGEAVDAVLKLPNEKLLPIDSKFPLDDFEKFVRAENEQEKESYRKSFISEVKREIDDIAYKYILPSEGTVDSALMYIPAEAVYYELMNNIKEDISSYAWSKRIIIVSPNTFYLTLAAIRHWFHDVEVSQKTQEIIKRLSRISIDGKKLEESFGKLGKHLSDARGSYEDSEKRLDLMINRVENIVGQENQEVETQEQVKN